MRKYTFFTVFFLVCFSLFGQTAEQTSVQAPDQKPEYKIYVYPITGYGKEKDTDYFYKQLGYEVFFQHHLVVGAPDSSNYIFKGTIEPVSGVPMKILPSEQAQKENYNTISQKAYPPVINAPGRREYFSIEKSEDIYFLDPKGEVVSSPPEVTEQMEEKGYYFILEMLDSKTGKAMGRKKMLFYVTDASVSKLISVIVYDLLSDIPPLPKRGDSRDRWLYFETSALWMPKYYKKDDINLAGFGMKLGMEIHFARYMSLAVGGQATQEYIKAGNESGFMLEVPLALKFVFSIDNNYSLEPYGGGSLNSSFNTRIHPDYSWFAGVQLGIKDKSETGMFVIDPRFSMDLFNASYVDIDANNKIDYRRYCVQIGFGYKFGVVQKKR